MNLFRKAGLFVGIAVSIAAVSAPSFAQAPGGGGGGFGGRQGGRRGGQMVTVAQLPVSFLASSLKLTDDQKTKITDIETKLQTDQAALRPQPGAQPDPQAFQTNRQKMQDLNQKANDDINAVLTDDQKTAVASLMKDVQAMNVVGISVASLGELNLTDDQTRQIVKIGTDVLEARTRAEAVLTDTQKEVLKKYPQQGFGGGRQGFGGGRQGAGGRRGQGGQGAPQGGAAQ